MTTTNADATSVFFDGRVGKKRRVALTFGGALEIVEDGAFLAAWAYADVRRAPGPAGVMRLRSVSAPELAKLEVRDPALQAEIERRCSLLDGEKTHASDSTWRIVGWSLAATASLVGLVWFGVPYAADRIAPLVPLSWEKRFGEAADNQVRSIFDGKSCAASEGAAALEKLSNRLQKASGLRLPATIETVQSETPNAFALPGGKVYLFSGLLEKAETQDEIIGVLAHELGHLQNRDHVRRLIADGGVAYIFGLLFGDVTGGGAVILVGKTLINARHSREAETAADDFAARTMAKLQRSSKAMGDLLLRVTGPEKDGVMTILHDHPLSEDRLERLKAMDKGAAGAPILSDAEWKALKKICE